jgi:GNAT superfamily N-acetyltransferase
MRIVPLDGDLVADAAAQLADRHARHRAAEPLLPVVTEFRPHVEAALEVSGAAGVVALREGHPTGFLIGSPVGESRIEVGFAGHAAADPEVARDLYTTLAQGWVDAGRTRHVVYVPATDRPLADAWFRLAFGLEFSFAVREVEPVRVSGGDVVVRAGRPDDLEAAAALERSLAEHQALAPSFSGRSIPPPSAFQKDWADTWSDPSFTHVVAERDGAVVGQALMYLRPTGDLRIPESSIDLAQAEVIPDERGNGVGSALFAHVMNWAHDQGYQAMTVDWRSVNLLASRFWTARGFRPTYHRLTRSIP